MICRQIKLSGKNKKYVKFLLNTDGEESCMAKLIGTVHPTNVNYTENYNMYILPPGGPIIIENEYIHPDLPKVKKIHYIEEKYYIEFYEK